MYVAIIHDWKFSTLLSDTNLIFDGLYCFGLTWIHRAKMHSWYSFSVGFKNLIWRLSKLPPKMAHLRKWPKNNYLTSVDKVKPGTLNHSVGFHSSTGRQVLADCICISISDHVFLPENTVFRWLWRSWSSYQTSWLNWNP